MTKIWLLLAVSVVLPLAAAACGGGDKEPKTAPTSTAVAERSDDGDRDPEADTDSDAESQADSDTGATALDGILPTIFEQAFAGQPGEEFGEGLEPGDPELLGFLPDATDLPDGYDAMGEFVFRAPDGISEVGAGDIAMLMASRGDPDDPDPAKSGALIAMVMRFDDLQDLEDAFGGVSREDFEDALLSGTTGMEGVDFVGIDQLDTDGLGENALGVGFTIDMSAFFEALIESFSPDGELPDEASDLESFTKLNMRMYLFGVDDLAGGIIRVGFGDSLDDGVDELELARALHASLSE